MQGANYLQYVNQEFLNNPTDAYLDTLPQPNMVSIFLNLQQTVVKQQKILQLLVLQQQLARQHKISLQKTCPISKDYHQGTSESLSGESVVMPEMADSSMGDGYLKEEAVNEIKQESSDVNSSLIIKRESSIETTATAKEPVVKCEANTELANSIEEVGVNQLEHGLEGDKNDEEFKIIRRNGFKQQKKEVRQKDIYNAGPRKSNKLITPKRPPSKAKHLWINYGRKIIDFALSHTKDEVNNRIKQYIGKLTSKKDFEEVFGFKETDSEGDRDFKIAFGRLALFFLKFKADTAFEDSKYREQMLNQKDLVATFIAKLITA